MTYLESPLKALKLTSAAAVVALGSAGYATAQYPEDSVEMVVSMGAGGGTDTVMRALAEPLAEALDATILVSNRPGAGGAVAALAISQEAPDGYTLLAGNSTTFTLEPHFVDIAYDIDAYDHIAIVAQFQEAFVTRSDSPFDSLREMLDHHLDTGEPIQYASFYPMDRLVTGYIGQAEGVVFEPVPVDGGAAVMNSVLGGHTAFGISGGSFMPHVESGDAKLLGAATRDRLEMFPDMESMDDMGYPVGTENHLTLSVPAGTPDDVKETLANAIEDAMEDEQIAEILAARGMRKSVYLLDEVDEILERQAAMFQEMIDAVGELDDVD